MENTEEAVPEFIEVETSERTWADFDDDGALITGRDDQDEY